MAALLLVMLRFVVDFFLVAVKENSIFLDFVVDKIDDGKIDKTQLKKQLLLFTE